MLFEILMILPKNISPQNKSTKEKNIKRKPKSKKFQTLNNFIKNLQNHYKKRKCNGKQLSLNNLI